MKTFLSSRARRLKPSATLAIAALEKEMRGRGIDVVGFGAGEPDFPTPSHIREAAKRSLDRGETFYTPVGGTPALKNAVAQRVRDDYGLDYKAEEILVSCGAKHCLANVFQAVLDPGDEAIVLAPYWVSYPEMIELADAVPVIVPTREGTGFVPDPEEVEARITPRTKAILVNSPSNPTGVLYPAEILAELARIAEKHDLLVISDEIYDKLVYDGGKFTPFAALPGMKDRTILVNGVSKTYAMTGFRIGYLASTRTDIVKAATNIQSQSTSNPASTAQAAAVEALTGPQDEVARMVEVFEKRRNLMIEEINKIEGLSVVKPGGAFYAFVNTSRLYLSGKVSNSADLARYLLETRHVACVPGGPFGSEDHVRLSFATGEETILKGLERLREVCQELL
ncbi:MAG: pyridoxal phosphate-dependent aminotransferase [Desulfomonile sp.]|nr:pyridoxal phosphate-dependent aminotransferase [Desulfomonile sp.]